MRHIPFISGALGVVLATSLALAQSPAPSAAAAAPARPAPAAASAAASATAPANLPRYLLDATIDPKARTLDVRATIEVPPALAGQAVEFLLAAPLQIVESEPAVQSLAADAGAGFSGINGSSASVTKSGRAKRYRAQLPAGSRRLVLHYSGRVDFGFDTPGQEYARGFNETAGTIREDGLYLAGSTLWYPYLGETLMTFELAARAPEGWQLVSPGNGTARDAQGVAHWRSDVPLDELHIVGGPSVRYARAAGAVTAEVYLRQKDDALAAKYLEATARNLEMYRGLIGTYPYEKFALVENFWETGYGMPSFTLLGPQIIRFPFILTSSYPHEILHNWWGNGVFVDYASGNWCEGLTAYLADHLYKEQQSQGAEYRRDTLKKYRDFVKEGRDFPLTEFRSRHSPATEAVGYGKALMTFHMARRQVGDEAYVRGLQRFYREQRGKRATFDDLARAQGAAANVDLAPFFRQWVTRTGAPDLRVVDARQAVAAAPAASATGATHVVRGTLRQVQKAEPFAIDVPVAVRTAQGTQVFTAKMTGRESRFEFAVAGEPLSLEVDPEFDLFRLLDARETAPSLGQMFGEPEVVAVLPAKAAPEVLAAYREMLKFWSGGDAQKFIERTDADRAPLPGDKPVWVFGRDNALAAKLFGSDPATGYEVGADAIVTGGGRIPYAGHSAVIVRRHPGNPAKAIGWITIDPLAAAPGLARKLPHYGKYSYLGFAGTEPANDVKGEWIAADSPLHVDLRPASQRSAALPAARYPARQALARLPAVFDGEAMARHVQWLADPAREGRGLGTAGLEASGRYVAEAFRAAGLAPARAASAPAPQAAVVGGNFDDYFQDFEFTPNGAQKPVKARNVIGVLRGADPKFANEAVIVSAHYDHLGRNGPGVRVAEIGQVHPGADDNASGVAVLLELARAMANAGAPPRTVVFIAFSGEESGLNGSKYYVANPVPVPLAGIRSVLNFDTVGRLGNGEVQALATGTATEWQHVFRGITFSTGIPTKSIPGASQSSDQQSFIDRGIPGVQLFTGAHLDYHRPSDTADKIDVAGLVKVATVAREAADYLVQRPTPLTATIAAPAGAGGAAGPSGASGGAEGRPDGNSRRVSFGLVPDYAFQGPGVRAESVVPNSPAARAGFEAGDVLLEVDGQAVNDLGAFSAALKHYKPGDKVKAKRRHGDADSVVTVDLSER
ncbi:MAG: M20/M25/M40 family metallo-hydrolase [Steroidobacteraceae bacterium]